MPAVVRVVNPPAAPVIGLPEARQYLKVDDDADDLVIRKLLASAAADAGQECGRGFGVATYSVTFDGFPIVECRAVPIRLPVRPVTEVVALRYRDADGVLVTMPTTDYWVGSQAGVVFPVAGAWPATQTGRPECVEVEFTAGHAPADLPPQAWAAIMLILADRYEHRGDEGDATEWPAVKMDVPLAAKRLLWQLHLGW